LHGSEDAGEDFAVQLEKTGSENFQLKGRGF